MAGTKLNLARGKEGPHGGAQAGDRVSSSVEGTWKGHGHQVGQDPAGECSQWVEKSGCSHLPSTGPHLDTVFGFGCLKTRKR